MGYRDYEDDWDETPRWPWWRALLGIVVALGLIAVAAIANPHPGAYVMIEAVGRFAGTIILFYGLAWFLALRRAHWAWKLIGLIAIVGGAFLLMAGAEIRERLKEGDMAGLRRDLARAANGGTLKAGVDDGSVAATVREMAVTMQADQRDYQRELEAAGVTALASPAALRARPDVLKNCGRIEALDATVLRYRALWQQRVDATRAALVTKHNASPQDLADYDAGAAGGTARTGRRWDLERTAIKEVAAACRVLARRRWQPGGPGVDFAFTSQRDLDEYRGIVTRMDAITVESNRLQAESLARMQQAGTQR